MKRIAITFAGRQDRMGQQWHFMQDVMQKGLFDEWHIWDFSRNQQDKAWLQSLDSNQKRFITTASEYLAVTQNVDNFKVNILGRKDAHIMLELEQGVIEMIIGAHDNTQSLLRLFPSLHHYDINAEPKLSSPLGLIEGNNMLEVKSNAAGIIIYLQQQLLFQINFPQELNTKFKQIYIGSGMGAHVEWRIEGLTPHAIKLYQPPEGNHQSYSGFQFLYHYYSHADFADDIFVKMDDDIVYVDTETLPDFLAQVEALPAYHILSANVINNGVCAYFQQQKGYFPNLNLNFEYPLHGTGGSLWESGQYAQRLHEYFVQHFSAVKHMAQADEALTPFPHLDRFSINFIGFKHAIFLYMCMAYAYGSDDELLMTQNLPYHYGIEKAIFNRMLVSHLSFFKQDGEMNCGEMIKLYRGLE